MSAPEFRIEELTAERDEAEANAETAMVQRDLAMARVEALEAMLRFEAYIDSDIAEGIAALIPSQHECRNVFVVGGESLTCERPPGHLGKHACPSAVAKRRTVGWGLACTMQPDCPAALHASGCGCLPVTQEGENGA